MSRKNILELISMLLISLFVYASVSKLMVFGDSLVRLKTSPLIGPFAHYLVWFIPAIEMLITILLFVNTTRLIGFYASVVLLLLFTGYIFWVLNFSPRVPCSCGGVIEKLSWKEHIVFNLVFICMAVAGIIFQKRLYNKPMTTK